MSGFDIPKIDLHLHLDGAIEPALLFELARERHIDLPAKSAEELVPFVVYDPACHSVNEYLKKFELPTAVLQDAEALERVTYKLGLRLKKQGLAYAEIRFAPQLHTKKGLSQRDAILAVEHGARRATADAGIPLCIICCCMSFGNASLNRDANIETVKTAAALHNDVVRAVDLAGAEGLCPLTDYAELFELARSLDIPYTCHAGDSVGADTVEQAITVFGSRRIGHGHHAYDDPEVLKLALSEGVTFEICLSSNIQCETQPSFEQHPAKKMLEMGHRITLNTDNPVIADTTLDKEYAIALERCGFTERDLVLMNLNSARAAFAPVEITAPIIAALEQLL